MYGTYPTKESCRIYHADCTAPTHKTCAIHHADFTDPTRQYELERYQNRPTVIFSLGDLDREAETGDVWMMLPSIHGFHELFGIEGQCIFFDAVENGAAEIGKHNTRQPCLQLCPLQLGCPFAINQWEHACIA